MIYDLLENIGRYRGICPNLDTAIRFLMDTDLNTLPTGKTEIHGGPCAGRFKGTAAGNQKMRSQGGLGAEGLLLPERKGRKWTRQDYLTG